MFRPWACLGSLFDRGLGGGYMGYVDANRDMGGRGGCVRERERDRERERERERERAREREREREL